MDAAKIKIARSKAENQIYEFLNTLERSPKGKDGYNAGVYRKWFNSLTDKQFVDYMKKLATDEWGCNLHYELNPSKPKENPDMQTLKAVSEKYKIPLLEYVAYPYKNPRDPEHPVVSVTPVPVICTIVRPLQQMLDKKTAMSSDEDQTNLLTGQVTGKSKAATFSNMQTISLATSGQEDTVKEFLGPRSDDEVSKAQMIEQIEKTGDFDINSITLKTEDKQSIETTRVFLTGAGLRVSFGKRNLSYALPIV